MNEHDQTIEAVLVGQRSRDEPGIRAHLDGCAECCTKLDRLEHLAQRLDVLAGEESQDLESARQEPGVDTEFERVLDQKRVRDAARSGPGRAGPAFGVRALLAAAAAILLALFIASKFNGRQDNDWDRYLGGDHEIELIQPVELPTLNWRLKLADGAFGLPAGGQYRLTIIDDTASNRGAIVVKDEPVSTATWSPSDLILPITLPAEFYVLIEAYDSHDQLFALLSERLPPSSD